MKINLSGCPADLKKNDEITKRVRKAYDSFTDPDSSVRGGLTGWVDLPIGIESGLVEDILDTAEEIRKRCSFFVVIGIGGSYLGAKTVIDALGGKREGFPDVEFAGYGLNAHYHRKILDRIDNEETCICVISKSGKTLEPLLAYSLIKEKLISKYGSEEADKRTYVITDSEKGVLREEVREKGLKAFSVPDDIGGRYSVLTAVGLLPIAVSGADITMLLKGAFDMRMDSRWESELTDYAATRVAMFEMKKTLEIFVNFDIRFYLFGDWLQQLFGESEGKEGKGIFPVPLYFSRDLHSIGQFIQQGNRFFFETMIVFDFVDEDLVIPERAGEECAGRTLEEINGYVQKGVYEAHRKEGIPVIVIEAPLLDEYNLGQLIFFFEMSAALSAAAMGVNPFDQPGVENYKSEVKKLLEGNE